MQHPNIIIFAALLLLTIYIGFLVLSVAEPIHIKDVPQEMHIASNFSGGDWGVGGTAVLSNSKASQPKGDFFMVGDKIFANDINLTIRGNPKITTMNLILYGLPEELSNKECSELSEEETQSFSSMGIYGVIPTEKINPEGSLSTQEIFKKGSWKIMLCLEYFGEADGEKYSSKTKIEEHTIDVITKYDLATLEYQKRAGIQSYSALFVSTVILILTVMATTINRKDLKK